MHSGNYIPLLPGEQMAQYWGVEGLHLQDEEDT